VKVASAGTTPWYMHGIRQSGDDGDDCGDGGDSGTGTSDVVALVGASSGKGRRPTN